MADDKTLRAGIEVTTGDSEQNLKQVEKGEQAVGVSGEEMAQKVTVAVQQVEQATSSAAQTTQQLSEAQGALATTTDAAASSVAAESQSADHLGESLDSAKSATEAATEATSGLSGASTEAATGQENLGDAAKKAADDLKAEADEIAKATAGIKTFADEADRVAGKLKAMSQGPIGPQLNKEWDEVAPRIQAVRVSVENLNASIKNGTAPTKTSIKELAVQYELLKMQIVETYGSLENPAAQAAVANYQALGAEIEVVIEKQARLANVAREAGEEFDRQSGKLDSVDKAIESIGGNYGKLMLQMGLYAGLVGVAIGAAEKLANAIDDEGKAVDGYKEKASSMAAEVKHAFYEMGAAGIDVFAKLGHGEREETRATVELEHALENLAYRFVATKEKAAGLRAEQAAGLPILERLKSTEEQLKNVGDFYALTLQRGALGQREWAAAVAESGGTLEGLIAAINRQRAAMEGHTEALKLIKAGEAEVAREREKQIQLIEAEIDALDKEINQIKRWANETNTKTAAEEKLLELLLREAKLVHDLDQAHGGTTESITKELEIIKEHLKYGDLFSQQLAGEAEILRDLIAKTDSLTTAERNRLNAVADAIGKFKDLAEKQESLREQLNAELDQMTVLKNASREELDARVKKIHALEDEIAATSGLAVAQKAADEIQKLQTETTRKASTAVITFTKDAETGKITITNQGEAAEETASKIEKVDGVYTNVHESAIKVTGSLKDGTAAISNAGAAAEEAAGKVAHLATATDQVAEAEKKHASQFGALESEIVRVGNALHDHLTARLQEVQREAELATKKINEATDAVNALANADGSASAVDSAGVAHTGGG